MTVTKNNNNRFLLSNKKNETIKERFANKSKQGISVAGKTSRLENIYTNLLLIIQENILLKLI